jgi:protein-S-isoprenylcysteine O-methyltransferase Ste14
MIGDARWPGGTLVHEIIEWVGIVLIVTAILGRTWCSLYIGGRKIASLVMIGPYSVTRNPLYVFSVLGAIGAGAQVGSALLALATGLIVYLVFLIVAFKEEQALTTEFGAPYQDYVDRVPRFMPDFSLWRDVDKLEVTPRRVAVTFFDGLFFLLAIPLAEGIEYLHDSGTLPTLFVLP